jgi:hypothetical protein
MAKQDDLPKTNPSEIEALLERVKRSGIEPRDAQLVERLLRLLLLMASLLEHKNASIKRLKRLIFGPGSDKRTASESKTEQSTSDTASSAPVESEPSAGRGADSGQAYAADPMPKRPGHGRRPASAYTGARLVLCRHPRFKAGDPIRKVQDLLGHKHVTTTQIYDKRRIATSQSASHNVPI